jgi:Flp pilus assembly protein TadD
VATVLNNLATLLAVRGRNDEAVALFEQSLAMFRRIYGDAHWRIGTVQGGLAGVLSEKGDPRAGALYRDALAQLEKLWPATHPSLEPVLLGLGRHLTRTGQPAEAEGFIRRALDTRTSRLGAADPRTAEAQVRLGVALAALGRAGEARPLLTTGHDRIKHEPLYKAEAHEAERCLKALPM